MDILILFIRMLLTKVPSIAVTIAQVFREFAEPRGWDPDLAKHLETIDEGKHATIDARVDKLIAEGWPEPAPEGPGGETRAVQPALTKRLFRK